MEISKPQQIDLPNEQDSKMQKEDLFNEQKVHKFVTNEENLEKQKSYQ